MASPRQPDLAHQQHDEVERCWLCGIALPTAQLVADGGSGCADVRWYCRDMRGCTDRWTTTARPPASRATAGPPATGSTTARPPGHHPPAPATPPPGHRPPVPATPPPAREPLT